MIRDSQRMWLHFLNYQVDPIAQLSQEVQGKLRLRQKDEESMPKPIPTPSREIRTY